MAGVVSRYSPFSFGVKADSAISVRKLKAILSLGSVVDVLVRLSGCRGSISLFTVFLSWKIVRTYAMFRVTLGSLVSSYFHA